MKLINSLYVLVLVACAPLWGAKFKVSNQSPNNIVVWVLDRDRNAMDTNKYIAAQKKAVLLHSGEEKSFDTHLATCFNSLEWKEEKNVTVWRINVESPKIMLTGKIALYAGGIYDKSFTKNGEAKNDRNGVHNMERGLSAQIVGQTSNKNFPHLTQLDGNFEPKGISVPKPSFDPRRIGDGFFATFVGE